MSRMFLRRLLFMQLGAAALPLCLMWAFVACLVICSDRSQDAHANYLQGNAQSITEMHSEDCPVAASSFVLPERQSYFRILQTSVVAHPTFAAPLLPKNRGSESLIFGPRFHSTSDPPLERLGILRI